MKKKKLKKKIKKLERTVKWNTDSQKTLALKCDSNQKLLVLKIEKLKETIKKLENNNKYYKEWMDRSGVDYKSWFNFEEKTCETCDYPGMPGCGVPCKDCSANPANKKENNNG